MGSEMCIRDRADGESLLELVNGVDDPLASAAHEASLRILDPFRLAEEW